MNMFKSNGGFTLVELIVVIAILAILAGVAVPAYSGYIDSAKEAGDITALAAVKTAVMAAYATEGTVTGMTVTANVVSGITIAGVSEPTAIADTDFYTFYGKNAIDIDFQSKKFASGATWAQNDTTGEYEWVPAN